MHRKVVFVCSIIFLQVVQVVAFQSPRETESPEFHDLIIPSTNVVVRQESAKVIFEFINPLDFGPTVKKNTPNDRITTVRVVNIFSEEMWKIEAPWGGQGASSVTYGVVPKGFRQTVPKGRKAPALEINEDYRVWVDGGAGAGAASFVYQGKK